MLVDQAVNLRLCFSRLTFICLCRGDLEKQHVQLSTKRERLSWDVVFCQPEPAKLDIFAETELLKIRELELAKIGRTRTKVD